MQTPDLSPLIQEIIDRPGWTAGNSMTFVFGHVSGAGVRWTESGNGGAPPQLTFTFGEGAAFQHAEPRGETSDCPGRWDFVLAGTGYTHDCECALVPPVSPVTVHSSLLLTAYRN